MPMSAKIRFVREPIGTARGRAAALNEVALARRRGLPRFGMGADEGRDFLSDDRLKFVGVMPVCKESAQWLAAARGEHGLLG